MTIHNFNPGPSVLPPSVLRQLQEEMVNFRSSDISLIEASHRSDLYREVHEQTIENLYQLLNIPRDYTVLLLSGGATLQFAMVPLNLHFSSPSGYVISGSWSTRAHADAEKLRSTKVLWNQAGSVPDKIENTSPLDFIHCTSNETIDGVQWKPLPDTGDIPLVVDMSSDMGTRTMDWNKISLAYASAQKNIGTSGVTAVIIRNELLERCARNLPSYLSYTVHAKTHSLYNTPPVFSIRVMGLMLQWMLDEGGLSVIEERCRNNASLIYQIIDEYPLFHSSVRPAHRSHTNVTFRIENPEKEAQFLSEAQEAGFIGIKGHRIVGGIRISMYSGIHPDSVQQLASFMKDFAQR